MVTIDELRERLERDDSLSTFHPLAVKIIGMVEDPDVSIVELEKVIEKDPVIAAEIIRVANSPLYMPTEPIKSLRYAISYLGMAVVRSVVIMVVLRGIYKKSIDTEIARYLWKHSVMTAFFAREFTTTFLSARVNRESVFLTTLLHDIGKIVFVNYYPEKYKLVFEEVKRGNSFINAEKDILGIDHCQVGAFLLARWLFPVDIVNAVGSHHEEPKDEFGAVILLSNLFFSNLDGSISAPTYYLPFLKKALEIVDIKDTSLLSKMYESVRERIISGTNSISF